MGALGFAVSLYQKFLPQKYNDPFTTNIYSNPLKSFGEVIVPNSKGYSYRSAWIMFSCIARNLTYRGQELTQRKEYRQNVKVTDKFQDVKVTDKFHGNLESLKKCSYNDFWQSK